MRAVIQRVLRASVTVSDVVVGEIGPGLCVLLGCAQGDSENEARWMAEKIAGLRIFSDAEGKMNLSVADVGGALLVVSQFTLLGDCSKGRRPSFVSALEPAAAEVLYLRFVELLRGSSLRVETGRFRADMQVSLTNDGPVTFVIDSKS